MATVYSLICFGGRSGKTVTFTDAGDVVNLTTHGLRNAAQVYFSGGTPPTGVSNNTLYYVKQGADSGKFLLYSDAGLTSQVTFTGTGSGTNKVFSKYFYDLTADQKLRYGAAGSERIYDSLSAWNTARTALATLFDAETVEIGDAFTDTVSGALTINVLSSATLMTTLVNGTRSAGFHAGVAGAGFIMSMNTGSGLSLGKYYQTVDGFSVTNANTSGNGVTASLAVSCRVNKMILSGVGIATVVAGSGVITAAGATLSQITNNVIYGFSEGITTDNYAYAALFANNTVCKNVYGVRGQYGNATGSGYWYNNIVVGNTTNWPAAVPSIDDGNRNAGLVGDVTWVKNNGTKIVIATTDFLDYANNDYHPAAIGSPQVETGIGFYGFPTSDLADSARPSYSGSLYGTTVSAGAFVTGQLYTATAIGTTDFTAIGATNNAVTFTDTGDTVGWTAHTVKNNTPVYFSSITSTTGISTNTIYYAVGAAANTFQVAATVGGTALALTTNGTGTVVLCPFKATGAGTGSGTATLGMVTDVGAYEYNLGYGLIPETHTIDFSGLVSGSQVVIYTTGTTTELNRNNSTGTTLSWDAATSGVTVDYTVLKAGYAPIRVTGVALTATSTPAVIQQDLDRAYATPSGLTFGTNVIVNVTARVVTSLQVTVATTVQNWYSYLMDSWIDSTTNTTLKNCAFPVIPFGEASFTTINGIEFSDGATSIAFFSRDGFRYSSDAGVTATAIWAAILTLNTPAGQQVKYRQTTGGSIVAAANTGPMDQLVQVYGNASHGNYDYRDHMVLRAPKVGWSQPQPDLVATYGDLQDGLYVAALEPLLQYACTDADIDAAHLALDNTAKTYTITAAHTMAELYQRAQWWANQDDQWDADIPLTTTDGSTFTQPSTWAMSGVSYLTAGTLSGGSATLAAGTQGIAYNGVTMNLGAAATYTFTMAGSCTVKVTPTSPSTYVFGSGTFNGTLTVNNMAAHAITIEIPNGVTTSTTGNIGGAITFSAPAIYQSVTVSGISTTSRVQIYDTTSSTELYNDVPGATSYVWTDSVAAAATRAIRVRIADCTTVTAKAFIEANIGTCATSGAGKDISYLASQVADATYNANAIDGSTVTGITIAPSPARVSISIAGGAVSWPQIYAYQVYWLATATGIADEAAFISAPDTANYLLTGFDIKNTHANPLTITGGWGRDSVTLTVAGCIDAAGSTGNIYPEPDHVVGYATGSGLTAGQAAELTAAASSSASAATAAANAEAAALALPDAATIASTVVVEAVDGTTTLAESLRLSNAVLAGKVSGAGTGTETFRDLADTKDRVVATVDSSGNRTALTRNVT